MAALTSTWATAYSRYSSLGSPVQNTQREPSTPGGTFSSCGRAAQTREAGTALPIGIGIHTGLAYVGVVGGGGDLSDFTALGDAVNITERLSSAAIAGELVISDAALSLSGYPSSGLTRRDLALKGVSDRVTTWSELISGGAAPPLTGNSLDTGRRA